MTLLGGLGTLSGPLVGSTLIVVIENKIGEIGRDIASISGIDWFNSLGESVTIVTGLIFVICVLLFRRGVMGELAAFAQRWTASRKS
jgi:branched-chain amino acid transport system permease protein